MVIKLNVWYLCAIFSLAISSSIVSMQKEESAKALTGIACKSISDYLASLNSDEAVRWVTSQALPEEVKEMVKNCIINSRYKLFTTVYFTKAISSKFTDLRILATLVVYGHIINKLEKVFTFDLCDYASYKLLEIETKLFFIVKPDNVLYIYDHQKEQLVFTTGDFKNPVHSIVMNPKNKALLLLSDDETKILYLDDKTGQYRPATFEEIVELEICCNTLSAQANNLEVKEQPVNKATQPTCLLM